VEFELDPKKAEAKQRKHRIEFLDAVIVFDGDRGITLPDEYPTEERYVTFGMDAQGRVLAVSTTLSLAQCGRGPSSLPKEMSIRA
jgi:uncharacterized DUF497 family protein